MRVKNILVVLAVALGVAGIAAAQLTYDFRPASNPSKKLINTSVTASDNANQPKHERITKETFEAVGSGRARPQEIDGGILLEK